MSKTLNEALATAKDVLESAEQGASHATRASKQAIGSAQEGAQHAVASVRSRWWDGVNAVAALGTMLRSFRTDDALGWAGLQRRRSRVPSWGLFGAGIAVGAGIGVMFAPSSGVVTRQRIAARLRRLARLEKSGKPAVAEKAAVPEKVASPLQAPAANTIERVEAKAEGVKPNHESATWPEDRGPRPL